jgi:phytanoyl-CoA hydroxylase
MIDLKTRSGLQAKVPETLAEGSSPRFTLDSLDEAAEHYRDNGYVILAGLIDPADCARPRALWEQEVKPASGRMYRQESGRLERHVFNEHGWVMNAVLNIQSLDPRRFPAFRAFAREHILSAPNLVRAFSTLLGAPPMIVQTMYFEGNTTTAEHQDSYYLDSEHIGAMAAAWIALEDIAATAGRFFICPGSHRLHASQHGADNCIAGHHESYIESVARAMKDRKAEICAPVLQAGDVLFWNSLTVHGSLESDNPQSSRSSITCHAIPAGDLFLQFQSKKRALRCESVNGVQIAAPKDLARRGTRVAHRLECSFPRLFQFIRNKAIRLVVSR